MAKPLVGFVSPPGWYDPSPLEFLELCEHAIRIQQCTLACTCYSQEWKRCWSEFV